METYRQIKDRHQADVNAFPLGFAFSDKQLTEMMQKFGLPNDKTGYAQIVSLGAGCFLRRSDIPAWKELTERHAREMKEFRKSTGELKKAFIHEFSNHESQFSLDEDTICRCVGLSWNEVKTDPGLLKIFRSAYKEFWKDCVENDRF